ncbi:hypothetical protein Bca4012_101118 [Brassica carinata]|uniref:Methionyl-tRNA formyltransferase, mitochondrial n=2 Tax=Brassica TaxID=3705 RepID=A0A078HEI9_BRANA|nr:methionyl-tRNA formyltransferase [Brassica napus]KAG2253381.1 hypothetical protein Bca52824_083517 [Brassica carinata]CAF2062723.1 unnamed protein product [Brassica napus]CDY36207.1 BnaC06g27510D [Brassica napus]
MNSALMLRRFICVNASATLSSVAPSPKKKPLIFLGSPQVSVTVLEALLDASSAPNSSFEVAGIVTQPPARRDRGRKVLPSPVAQYALEKGLPSDLIFSPEKAGDEAFLSTLRDLQPELCVTAAYGNILPTKFLSIPLHGTVNIHPSLLPLYRGAAPVQRALQDGVQKTGVSLAFTVRKLDAGAVIASKRFQVDDQIKAPELLSLLFSEGSKLLIRELPSIFDGSAKSKAVPQDDSEATLAPKIAPDEAWLSFDQEAFVLHNKVRAFAGWPGTRAKVLVLDDKSGQQNEVELKVITTRICQSTEVLNGEQDCVTFKKGSLVFPCGGGTALEVLEVQLPGKKAMDATAFWNGLRGQKLKKL